jgi:hypothetical protein
MSAMRIVSTKSMFIKLMAVIMLAGSIAVTPVAAPVAQASILGGALGGAVLGGLIGGRGGLIGGAIIGGVVGGVVKHNRRKRARSNYYRGRMDERYRRRGGRRRR